MKLFLTIIVIISFLYDCFLYLLSNIHMKKPLPSLMKDIYSSERYEMFLKYNKETKRLSLVLKFIQLLILLFIILSPILNAIDTFNNVYIISIMTILFITIINTVFRVLFDYIRDFKIESKYGKNKKTMKIFIKDQVIDFLSNIIINNLFICLLIFIIETLNKNIDFKTLTFIKILPILLIIGSLLFVVFVLLMLISYGLLRLQYKFTPLEDGELKDEINDLMKDCKKKVKVINVYNESSKSTSKNAFLLKMFTYREFGIADNFINENAHNELLAVLSHEIGHLKHKKNILNYIKYLIYIFIILFIILMLLNASKVIIIQNSINQSFALNNINYYLDLMFITSLFTPLFYIIKVYFNYVSRVEEYEADDEAIKNGYGEDLIKTFESISSDELINVYPSKIIEFLEYDHPSMYNRIKHLKGM